MIVVAGQVDELRVVERRIENGGADRMSIEMRLDLPVVEVGKVLFVPAQLARGGGEQIVVIAGQTGLTVRRHVQVVAGLRPADVIAQGQTRGASLDMHGVAGRSENRGALDHGIVSAVDKDARTSVAINEIVLNIRGSVNCNADAVVVNAVEAEHATLDQSACAVVVDVVGQSGRPVGGTEDVASFQANAIIVHPIAVDARAGSRDDADAVAVDIVEANYSTVAVQGDTD